MTLLFFFVNKTLKPLYRLYISERVHAFFTSSFLPDLVHPQYHQPGPQLTPLSWHHEMATNNMNNLTTLIKRYAPFLVLREVCNMRVPQCQVPYVNRLTLQA